MTSSRSVRRPSKCPRWKVFRPTVAALRHLGCHQSHERCSRPMAGSRRPLQKGGLSVGPCRIILSVDLSVIPSLFSLIVCLSSVVRSFVHSFIRYVHRVLHRREYYYHVVTRKVSWELPDEKTRAATNALAKKIQQNQERAQQKLAKEREESEATANKAFEMDADLNKRVKKWRSKKSFVAVLNSLGDILPKCAPNFSVSERYRRHLTACTLSLR